MGAPFLAGFARSGAFDFVLCGANHVNQTMWRAGASPAAFDFVGVITYALVSKYWRTTNDGYVNPQT